MPNGIHPQITQISRMAKEGPLTFAAIPIGRR